MKKILLIYKTKTGFTKKYADWIADEIKCDQISFEEFNGLMVDNYDIIIYGAGMHAGHVNGFKKFRNKVKSLDNREIVVFATGGTPYKEEVVGNIKDDNFQEEEKKNIKFFYFQSGINYEKMVLFDKIIMKVFSKLLQIKKNKSEIEAGTSKAIATSYDHSSKEHIKPMINYLEEIIK